MSSLSIDFGYDDNVISSVKKAKRAINSRITDYTGIKNDLNGISSSTGNLSTANSYIQKKITSLQGKYDRLDSFQNKIQTFNDDAENADKRVANRINTETNQFYKRENIPNGILYTIGSAIGEGVAWLKAGAASIVSALVVCGKSAWAAIKEWYANNKYWIDVVVDVVCVVAAAISLIATVVTGGTALAVVVGIWGFAKAGVDLVYDGCAYNAYKAGDLETYKELSAKGMKELLTENYGNFGLFIYTAFECVSLVYTVTKVIEKVKVFEWGEVLKKTTGWGGISYGDLEKLSSIEKTFTIAKVWASDTKFIVKGLSNLISSDNIKTGTIKSIKLTKEISSAYSSTKELLTNIWSKFVFPSASTPEIVYI